MTEVIDTNVPRANRSNTPLLCQGSNLYFYSAWGWVVTCVMNHESSTMAQVNHIILYNFMAKVEPSGLWLKSRSVPASRLKCMDALTRNLITRLTLLRSMEIATCALICSCIWYFLQVLFVSLRWGGNQANQSHNLSHLLFTGLGKNLHYTLEASQLFCEWRTVIVGPSFRMHCCLCPLPVWLNSVITTIAVLCTGKSNNWFSR